MNISLLKDYVQEVYDLNYSTSSMYFLQAEFQTCVVDGPSPAKKPRTGFSCLSNSQGGRELRSVREGRDLPPRPAPQPEPGASSQRIRQPRQDEPAHSGHEGGAQKPRRRSKVSSFHLFLLPSLVRILQPLC